MNTKALTFLLLLMTVNLTKAQHSGIIADGAVLTKVSSAFSFTEGPAMDKEGNVYFTDQPNDRILKWSPDNTLVEFMKGTGRSNGMYFDDHGNLFTCADENNEIWKIDKAKNVTVLVTGYQGKKLNGPNDLWIDKKGGFYFTDPFYKRKYWTRTEKEIPEENVYYLPPGHKNPILVAGGFKRPNGIIGTPDGRKLYVADIDDNKTYEYSIKDDGGLADRKLFTNLGSDGMTIDNQGNVYLTGKGVTVFNAKGEQIEHIAIDEPWTANVCFGGEDQQTLFITASTAVYTLRMKVKGVRY